MCNFCVIIIGRLIYYLCYYYGRPAWQMGTLYFCPVVSSSFFLLFSSPNLSGHRLDVYHTSTHGVALVRI